jgi:hypothetical protein
LGAWDHTRDQPSDVGLETERVLLFPFNSLLKIKLKIKSKVLKMSKKLSCISNGNLSEKMNKCYLTKFEIK